MTGVRVVLDVARAHDPGAAGLRVLLEENLLVQGADEPGVDLSNSLETARTSTVRGLFGLGFLGRGVVFEESRHALVVSEMWLDVAGERGHEQIELAGGF